jgi:hypothetical protein
VTCDEDRERAIREVMGSVQARLLAMPADQLTGSVSLHLQNGQPRRLEWRLVEAAPHVPQEVERRDRA